MEETSKMSSQLFTVAVHLLGWGELTSWDAIRLYGITRLSAHIWMLRHKYDWGITSHRVSKKNEQGRTCTYVVYTLEGVGKNVA